MKGARYMAENEVLIQFYWINWTYLSHWSACLITPSAAGISAVISRSYDFNFYPFWWEFALNLKTSPGIEALKIGIKIGKTQLRGSKLGWLVRIFMVLKFLALKHRETHDMGA